MRILVLNTGSSSVKYKLFAMPEAQQIAAGYIERIGRATPQTADYEQALQQIFAELGHSGAISSDAPLTAIGHRVVHGGAYFRSPVLVDASVLERLRQFDSLAPLHNPAARAGIEAAQRLHGGLPQILVFDTAFFHTLEPAAYRYAIPAWCFEELSIRRYGFHGTSHQYVSQRSAEFLERPVDQLRMITLHLGNGASAAAIAGGRAVDTSMGLTPLEGLVMGTRSGDIDPAVFGSIHRGTGRGVEEIERLLNRESGLLGVCGEADMREVLRREAAGDEDAALAVRMYIRRIHKYIGSYYALLGGLDAIVFTAGVGEHSSEIRERVCEPLSHLGIELNRERNAAASRTGRRITTDESRVAGLVIPTDEERAIAELVARSLEADPSAPLFGARRASGE